MERLRVFMLEPHNWEQPAGHKLVYSLHGDPAYPQSMYVFGGYRNPPQGSLQAAWNTQMLKVQEVVEWGFASITTNWSFLDLRQR